MKSAVSSQRAITAHDTLQRLSYAKRPAFNALWEPRDVVSIDVKATEKRRILGDEYLESIIKERPRRYMTPSVCLDDMRDKDKRKLMIDFIYRTTIEQAAKEVWRDFEIQSPCLEKKRVEVQEKPLTDRRIIARLPARFQGAAKKWDSMQSRSFLVDSICYDTDKTRQTEYMKEIRLKIRMDKEREEKDRAIRELINENKLSVAYDKLPLSYTGYRSYVAYGAPLERKETRRSANQK